ncbi:MAG: DMT family transporter [Microbacteriaceae bacterium]|nr:DMT family transporter [Microbacteriaceae bacterium]
MLTVALGLAGALIFGASDFLGGLAARATTALRTTLISFTAALAVTVAVLPFTGSVWSTSAVWLGLLAGVGGAGALFLLYACLAIGPMSTLSPITALVAAVVPIIVALATGEKLAALGLAGLAVALIAVVLIGFVPDKNAQRASLKAILMAIGSGTLIGSYLILIHRTPKDSGIIPLVADLASGTVVTALVMLVLYFARPTSRPVALPWRAGLWFAIWCGVTQTVGNIFIVIGLHIGSLSVMAVLNALYPAGTIILAGFVLKERVTPLQWVGLVLAIVAAGMLALAS